MEDGTSFVAINAAGGMGAGMSIVAAFTIMEIAANDLFHCVHFGFL